MHPETRRGVDLADGAAGLAHRLGDVRTQEIDSGDVQADHPGRLFGDIHIVRMRLEGPVDRDAPGRHVSGERQLHHLAPRRHVAHLEALGPDQFHRRVGHFDAGEHLFVPDAAARVGIGQLDQFRDGALSVADDVGGHPFGDRDHVAADDQHPVVLAGDERLDQHVATP